MPPAGAPRFSGTSVLCVATALAFLPLANLPSFDAVKLPVLGAGAAVLSFVAARRRPPAEREAALRDPLLAVPAIVAIAAGVAAALAWPRGSLIGPAIVLCAVLAARCAPVGRDGLRATMRALALAASVCGAYGVLQTLGLDFAEWASAREAVATFGNPSFAAEFQAAALPAALVLALRPLRRGDRALGIAGVVLAAAHLAAARSRIDLVAAGAAVAVCAVVLDSDRSRARKVAIGAGAGAVATAALFVLAARGDVGFLGRSDTLRVRAEIWGATLDAIAESPFRFAGAPFTDVFPPHRSPDEYRISLGRVVDTPHMDLLEVAATLGLAGLAAALAWLVLLARRIASIFRTDAESAACLASVAAAIFVSGLASSPMTHPATAFVAALVAAHAAHLSPRRESRLSARTTDFVACALAILVVWPGPALRTLRSDTFLAVAMTERSAGRTREAAIAFDAACAANPQAFEARYELGSHLLATGEEAAAVAPLESAIAIRPNAPDARTNLVHALRGSGRSADAERLLDESLARTPWDPLLLAARAQRHSAAGRAADALRDLDQAAPLRPWDLRIRAVRADARLAASGDASAREEAVDVLLTARATGDFRVFTQAARAYAERDAAFLGVLISRARRIVATEPDVAVALVLAPVEGLRPRDPGYFDDAAKVLQECGRDAEATVLRGRAMGLRAAERLAAGDADGARRLADRAADRDPRPEHRVVQAIALARTGDATGAREALSAAIALGPVDVAALRAEPAIARIAATDEKMALLLDRAASRPPPTR